MARRVTCRLRSTLAATAHAARMRTSEQRGMSLRAAAEVGTDVRRRDTRVSARPGPRSTARPNFSLPATDHWHSPDTFETRWRRMCTSTMILGETNQILNYDRLFALTSPAKNKE